MQENKTAWIVAVVVVLVVAAVAWWYVGTGSEIASPTQSGQVAAPATVPPLPQTVAPAAPAADSTGAIERDLNAADSGSLDLDNDVDMLDVDIQNNL
ncbi:MAG: hypothetical protein HYY10_03745 [Candidatus Liptonbacteria bacterium]|nr:hypothetical protein [Candidatus Liptonbacteria bacterium]